MKKGINGVREFLEKNYDFNLHFENEFMMHCTIEGHHFIISYILLSIESFEIKMISHELNFNKTLVFNEMIIEDDLKINIDSALTKEVDVIKQVESKKYLEMIINSKSINLDLDNYFVRRLNEFCDHHFNCGALFKFFIRDNSDLKNYINNLMDEGKYNRAASFLMEMPFAKDYRGLITTCNNFKRITNNDYLVYNLYLSIVDILFDLLIESTLEFEDYMTFIESIAREQEKQSYENLMTYCGALD